MKFGREFGSQMVPEWHEAYINYPLLKTSLKQIKNSKQTTKNDITKHNNSLKRNHTLYREFSGLTHHARNSPTSPNAPDIESQVIHVNSVRKDGLERFETTFLKAGDEGGEFELVYFKRLDEEFNKVLGFYKSKVGEVLEEAGVLNKQMDALIAFRFKVEHPKGWINRVEDTVQMVSDVQISTKALSANAPLEARSTSRRISMDVIDEESSTTMRMLLDESIDDNDNEKNKSFDDSEDNRELKQVNIQIQEDEQTGFKAKRPPPLEVLNQVKFNNDTGTPRSAIKGFLKLPNQTDLKFSKDNMVKAEAQLRMAFVEFYHKLRLLKNYCFLNTLAVSKIMKKYDKIASRNATRAYMKMVDSSYLGSSDEVSRLMERVEVTFIKHFSNSNRSKGMAILRPMAKRERHRTSFATGFLLGCLFALVLALILIIRAHSIIDREGRDVYMETLFPLYSLFGFVVLHMLMYAANIYFWRRFRVNYTFIFGFKQGTELGYKEVMLVSFSVSVLALASVLANLDMEMDPVTQDYQGITELIPVGLVVLVVGVMLCPLNIIYRSSRFFLLTCLLHCVLAPLYKVTLSDFMLADQLTSQVQAIRSLQFYICYYGWGDYKRRENNCRDSDIFNTFSFIVAVIPFWWRLLQCLRRMREERDIMQGYNGVKYFLTIVAVCARTAYTYDGGDAWKYSALVISIFATIISTYWDIVLDWGLLQRNAKNRWLRDKLLVPYKSVYFIAIVLNVVLRLAWMQTVMNITIFSLHRQTMIALVASLEIIRRGIWSFFRLENEHLNNVGKFRAFKSVPLPFNYEDEDKDD